MQYCMYNVHHKDEHYSDENKNVHEKTFTWRMQLGSTYSNKLKQT